MVEILQALKQEGLIDVFYLQIRYGPNLDPMNPLTSQQISEVINRISGQTGVPIIISELGFDGGTQESVTRGFTDAVMACKQNPMCLGIQFDKVVPENSRENELFSFVNGNALPDQDYFAIIAVLVK